MVIEYLADHREFISIIAEYFYNEWDYLYQDTKRYKAIQSKFYQS
jgi:hypothetical protein